MPDRTEDNAFARTALLIGDEALERLRSSRVAVFGVGGVGGYVCEALVRSGIGKFDLVDFDRVSLTNLNRQIIALRSTVGRYKVDVMKERMLDINPGAEIEARRCFFLPENADEFPFDKYDYVVDAVDTVSAKIGIVMRARQSGVPVISSMGAGNKLDGSRFRVSDIYETSVCPLARVMRYELRRRGVDKLKVVWSDEEPIRPAEPGCGSQGETEVPEGRRSVPGSTAFVPSVAGLLIAGEVVRDLAFGQK
ncbi:MAG: tRNA threonylcarbamoyladenosine dehydratase [Clostridia bacterium]|nr:tRNA threonylcarbamoyladenosine dehydratase [Clostridia bacterium]